jgi:hypothetical protein
MEVVWGHDTGVLEAVVRDFENNWSGTGTIENPGEDDIERLALEAGESMTSEVVRTGTESVIVLYNVYAAGDTGDLDYRTGDSVASCLAAGWQDYSGAFLSDGYVQIRITSTL